MRVVIIPLVRNKVVVNINRPLLEGRKLQRDDAPGDRHKIREIIHLYFDFCFSEPSLRLDSGNFLNSF